MQIYSYGKPFAGVNGTAYKYWESDSRGLRLGTAFPIGFTRNVDSRLREKSSKEGERDIWKAVLVKLMDVIGRGDMLRPASVWRRMMRRRMKVR